MFEGVQSLVDEHAALEQQLADPDLFSDQARSRRLNQRYAALTAVVKTYHEWQSTVDDLEAATELGAVDESFAAEAGRLDVHRQELEERMRRLLVPRDPIDEKDAILEIKAGEGGEESALFAGDLLRMYARYAETRGWRVELLDEAPSELGGVKSATVAVKAKGTPAPGDAPYAKLKFEGGVHRVQRVPVTESQGRIHTSAAGVLVMPEAEPIDVTIDENDLRIDVFRSSGPGGQSVNTTDSAVRITHLPTGLVVSQQDQKSQLQNKIKAMEVLRARLLDRMIAEQEAARSRERRSMVGTGDRSAKIRTYNFPQSRITDHRINLSVHNLSDVLNGNLDELVDSLRMASRQELVDA